MCAYVCAHMCGIVCMLMNVRAHDILILMQVTQQHLQLAAIIKPHFHLLKPSNGPLVTQKQMNTSVPASSSQSIPGTSISKTSLLKSADKIAHEECSLSPVILTLLMPVCSLGA